MYSIVKRIKEALFSQTNTVPELLCYCEKCEILATRCPDEKKYHKCATCGHDMKYLTLNSFRVLTVIRSIHGPYHNDIWILSDAYHESKSKGHIPYRTIRRRHPLEIPPEEE